MCLPHQNCRHYKCTGNTKKTGEQETENKETRRSTTSLRNKRPMKKTKTSLFPGGCNSVPNGGKENNHGIQSVTCMRPPKTNYENLWLLFSSKTKGCFQTTAVIQKSHFFGFCWLAPRVLAHHAQEGITCFMTII